MNESIELLVNGVPHQVDAPSETSVLEVLRNDLGLTGAKYGCGEGQCGACTVLLDDEAVHSCTLSLGEATGKHIVTIEGLASGQNLHPVQRAFLEEGAMQCGYCVPGMILRAVSLLKSQPNPSEGQIREGMAGNVCRCCGYQRMIAAVQRASGAGSQA
jgi:aerobic-type carbon monoxide dehydrogenase small subunit (CoxS/CutS family)